MLWTSAREKTIRQTTPILHGLFVYRLGHLTFTQERGVQFPYRLPISPQEIASLARATQCGSLYGGVRIMAVPWPVKPTVRVRFPYITPIFNGL